MTYLASYLAGLLSILSPCVLPLVPLVLATALRSHRLAPLALSGGIVFSFTLVGFFSASVGMSMGLDPSVIRKVAAVILLLAGLLMLASELQQRLIMASSPMFNSLNSYVSRFQADGLRGQATLGVLLGVVWSPCVGPTLGAAIGLAMQGKSLMHVAMVMFVFAIGTVSPLLLLTYAGGQAIARKNWFANMARYGKPMVGLFLLIIGFSIILGFDKVAETYITGIMPEWLLDITTRF